MIILEMVFAAYYRFSIRLRRMKFFRKMNRGGSEDFTAVALLCCSEFFILFIIFFAFRQIFQIKISLSSQGEMIYKVSILAIGGTLLYLQSKYLISNRERRNRIENNFLNSNKKFFWNFLAFFILLTPVYGLIFFVIRIVFRIS